MSKQDPYGNTLFTTYIGGKNYSAGTTVQVDARGGIYLTISASADFPVTGALQNANFGATYLLKMAGDGSHVDISTRITSAAETISALLLDDAGSIYSGSTTASSRFFTTICAIRS